jgi:hypothetical protein
MSIASSRANHVGNFKYPYLGNLFDGKNFLVIMIDDGCEHPITIILQFLINNDFFQGLENVMFLSFRFVS